MNKEKFLYENSKHALQSDNMIAITNRHLCSRPFMEQLERVCKLHPHAIVLREKDMPEAEYLSLARDVIALCKKYDVQCMLHSFINVAMELEHPYIHLPLPILEAYVKKNVSGNISTGMSKSTDNYQQFFKVIGTSVHSVEDAIKAEQLGATYMTAGHIFATDCKKDCLRADLISSKMSVMRLGYRFMQSAALILLQAVTALLPMHHPLMMLCQTLVFRDFLRLWNVEPPEDVLCRG